MVLNCKKYLRKVGRPARPTDEVASALSRGGLHDVSKDSLAAVLLRAAKGREVMKVGKGHWGLKEWYPERAGRVSPKRRAEEAEELETGEAEGQESK